MSHYYSSSSTSAGLLSSSPYLSTTTTEYEEPLKLFNGTSSYQRYNYQRQLLNSLNQNSTKASGSNGSYHYSSQQISPNNSNSSTSNNMTNNSNSNSSSSRPSGYFRLDRAVKRHLYSSNENTNSSSCENDSGLYNKEPCYQPYHHQHHHHQTTNNNNNCYNINNNFNINLDADADAVVVLTTVVTTTTTTTAPTTSQPSLHHGHLAGTGAPPLLQNGTNGYNSSRFYDSNYSPLNYHHQRINSASNGGGGGGGGGGPYYSTFNHRLCNNDGHQHQQDVFAYADQLRHDFRLKQTEFATYAKKLRLVDASSAYYTVLADHLLRVQVELNELGKKMAECIAAGVAASAPNHNNNNNNNNDNNHHHHHHHHSRRRQQQQQQQQLPSDNNSNIRPVFADFNQNNQSIDSIKKRQQQQEIYAELASVQSRPASSVEENKITTALTDDAASTTTRNATPESWSSTRTVFSNLTPIRTYGALQRKLLTSLGEKLDVEDNNFEQQQEEEAIATTTTILTPADHRQIVVASSNSDSVGADLSSSLISSSPDHQSPWCSIITTTSAQQQQLKEGDTEQDVMSSAVFSASSNSINATNDTSNSGVDTSSIYDALSDPTRVGGVALRRVVVSSPRDVFGLNSSHLAKNGSNNSNNDEQPPKFSRISVTSRFPSDQQQQKVTEAPSPSAFQEPQQQRRFVPIAKAPEIEIIERKGDVVRHQVWTPVLKERSWEGAINKADLAADIEVQQLSVRDLKKRYEEEQWQLRQQTEGQHDESSSEQLLMSPRAPQVECVASVSTMSSDESIRLKRKGILKKYGPIGATDSTTTVSISTTATHVVVAATQNGGHQLLTDTTPSARKLVADPRYKFSTGRNGHHLSSSSAAAASANFIDDEADVGNEIIEMESIDLTSAKIRLQQQQQQQQQVPGGGQQHPATPIYANAPMMSARRFNFFASAAANGNNGGSNHGLIMYEKVTEVEDEQAETQQSTDDTQQHQLPVNNDSELALAPPAKQTVRLLPTSSGGKRDSPRSKSEFVFVDELVQEAAGKTPFTPLSSDFLDADAASSYSEGNIDDNDDDDDDTSEAATNITATTTTTSASALATPSTSTGVSRNSSFLSNSVIERMEAPADRANVDLKRDHVYDELNVNSAITESDIEDFNEILDGTKYESERLSPAELARIDSLRSSLRSQQTGQDEENDDEEEEEDEMRVGVVETGDEETDATSESISTTSSSLPMKPCWPSSSVVASDAAAAELANSNQHHHHHQQQQQQLGDAVSNRAAELASQLQQASLLPSNDDCGPSANSGQTPRLASELKEEEEEEKEDDNGDEQTNEQHSELNLLEQQQKETPPPPPPPTQPPPFDNDDEPQLSLHHLHHQRTTANLNNSNSHHLKNSHLNNHHHEEFSSNTTKAQEHISVRGLDEYELTKKRLSENKTQAVNAVHWKTRFSNTASPEVRSYSPQEAARLLMEDTLREQNNSSSVSSSNGGTLSPPLPPASAKKINFAAWDARHLLRRLYAVRECAPDEDDVNGGLYSNNNNNNNKQQQHVFVNMEGYLERLLQGGRQTSVLKTWRRKYVRVRDGVMYTSEKSTDSIDHYRTDRSPLTGAKVSALDETDMFTVEEPNGRWNAFRCQPEERLQWLSAFTSQTVELPDSFRYIQPLTPTSSFDSDVSRKNVLVVDFGECSLRAGLLRNRPSLPDIFCPAAGAKVSYRDGRTVENHFADDAFGPIYEADHKIALTQAFKMSVSGEKSAIDFATFSGLLRQVIAKMGITNPNAFTLLLSIPFEVSPGDRAQLAQTLANIGFGKYSISTQELLVLYAYGCTDAVVVHIGEHMSVMPVVSGCAIIGGCVTLPYGGRDFVEAFNSTLPGKHICTFSAPKEMLIVRYLAENLCYVAENYEMELNACLTSRQHFQQSMDLSDCQLPDGLPTSFAADWGRFHASERIANPAICHDSPSLAQLVFNAIRACPIDNRRELYRNIVLSGGASCLPGFVGRLEADIRRLLPANSTLQVRVNRAPFAYHAPFVGATVLAAKPEFNQLCTSPSIVASPITKK